MNTKLSNKYWKKATEMEALTPKVSFYEYLMNNINNEEQESRKKAEEFYKKNKKKSLYNNSKLYIEYVRKAIELDGQNKNVEYDYKDVVSYIEKELEKLKEQSKKITIFFKLYETYRQDLEILSKDSIFINILLENENIEYSNQSDLLNIAIDLIQNYIEVQSIKNIQNVVLENLKVKYRVVWSTKPFRQVIEEYLKFLSRLGYKLNIDKPIDLPNKETKEFIKKEVDFLDNVQEQINKVFEHYQVSISIEGANEWKKNCKR